MIDRVIKADFSQKFVFKSRSMIRLKSLRDLRREFFIIVNKNDKGPYVRLSSMSLLNFISV